MITTLNLSALTAEAGNPAFVRVEKEISFPDDFEFMHVIQLARDAYKDHRLVTGKIAVCKDGKAVAEITDGW